MSSGDGREGSLSIRTVKGSGVHLGYKLGNKWYYTKMDSKLEDDEVLLPSRLPKKSGELSIKNGSLYVKRAQRETAKEILTNNSKAKIKALSLTLDDNKVIKSTDGAVIHIDAHDITDSYTATGGTTTFGHVKIEPPVLKASNAAVVTSHAGTLEITGPPSAGLNQTITNPYDIYLSNASSKIGATDLTIDVVGGQLTIESSAAGAADPDLILIGKHDSIVGYPTLQLESHRNGTDNNQDSDVLGEVGFYGYNDNSDRTPYAKFITQAVDVTDGDERGKFYFQVMTNTAGGSGSVLANALSLEGSTTDDVIDASIGYGATSMTTIAGDLDIDGDAITAPGNLGITPTGDFTVTPGGNDVNFNNTNGFNINGAAGVADPTLMLSGTNVGADGPIMKFVHIPGDASEADEDKLGRIYFTGFDSVHNITNYVEIEGLIKDTTTDTEAGLLKLKVITENASAPVLTTGLALSGSDTNDEVNVAIGAGTASVATIAGNLDIDGAKITSAGALEIDAGGAVSITGQHMSVDATQRIYLDGGGGGGDTYINEVSADKLEIVVGADEMVTLDEANDRVTIEASKLVYKLGSGGTEFSVADSAYAGMILGYRTLGVGAGRVGYSINSTFTTLDANAFVRFIAPPSGVVEVYVQAGLLDANSGRYIYFGLSDNATYNTLGAAHEELVNLTDETDSQIIQNTWVITGLTAGDTYNYWFGIKGNHAVSGTLNYGGTGSGHYSPFIMKVTALPTAVGDFAEYG